VGTQVQVTWRCTALTPAAGRCGTGHGTNRAAGA